LDAKQKSNVRVTHTKVKEREPVKLLPHKRQLTKIEKYKNENKGCRIDLSYKQLLQNHPRLPFLSLLDKVEIDKNLTLLNSQFIYLLYKK